MQNPTGIRNTFAALGLLYATNGCVSEDGPVAAEQRAAATQSGEFVEAPNDARDDVVDRGQAGDMAWQERLSPDDARQMLLGRIDPELEHIQLGVDRLPMGPRGAKTVFDRDRFARAIEDVSVGMVVDVGIRYLSADIGEKRPQWKAVSDAHQISVSSDFHLLVEEIEGAQDDTIPRAGSEEVDDDTVEKTAEELMSALGALSDEWGEPYIGKVGMASRSEESGPQPVEIEAIAKVVEYFRAVNGIPVRRNRMSIVFNLNGTFSVMTGRWQPFNYAKSDLSTDLSEEQIREAGVDLLLNAGHDPENPAKIGIETFYMPVLDEESGEYVLDLQAEVTAYLEPDPALGLAPGEGYATLDLVYDI